MRARGNAAGGGRRRAVRARHAGSHAAAGTAAVVLAAVLLAVPAAARADAAQPFLGWRAQAQGDSSPGSFFGGTTLGRGRFGVAASLGFPFLEVEAAYGLTPALDLRLGVATLYGGLNVVGVSSRWCFHHRGGFAVAARLGVDASLGHGDASALKLTMDRDVDVTGGVVVSARLGTTTFFADTGLLAAWNLAPLAVPLAGPPPPFTLGFALPVHLGVELPVNRNLGFVARFGIDVPLTATAVANATLPYVSVGLDLAG